MYTFVQTTVSNINHGTSETLLTVEKNPQPEVRNENFRMLWCFICQALHMSSQSLVSQELFVSI